MAHLALLVPAFIAGVILGVLFFGGLWITLSLVVSRSRPLLAAASFTVRSAVLLVGLWWVGRGDWRLMVACAAGVLAVRAVLRRHLGQDLPRRPIVPAEEG